jgi:hypothetical protein
MDGFALPEESGTPLLGIPLPDPGNYCAFFLRQEVAAQDTDADTDAKPQDAEGGSPTPHRGCPEEEVAGVQASQGNRLK